MIGDLPDLNDFFEESPDKLEQEDWKKRTDNYSIHIYVLKDSDKWLKAEFIDLAAGAIGLHILLPIEIELKMEELSQLRIRFARKKGDTENILKEIPVLVRWQETDNLTGFLKLGLHFHGNTKSDPELREILKQLRIEKES